jgi:intracellular sulfur oxidation DsrE/DsrF family protein
MEELKLPTSRRNFLGGVAATAAAGVGAVFMPVAGTAAGASMATDFTRWVDSIPGTHRQLYDMPELNDAFGLIWSYVFLLTGPQGYGVPESDLGVVVVLRHATIPLAFNDSAWAKYKLGEVFKIQDAATKSPALRNPYVNSRPGDLLIPDASVDKLVARGVKVCACNMAINFYSGVVAKATGASHDAVKKDWLDAVIPGVQVVPSGVLAINGAQTRGCSYVFAG